MLEDRAGITHAVGTGGSPNSTGQERQDEQDQSTTDLTRSRRQQAHE
jgi:hypothetical protein